MCVNSLKSIIACKMTAQNLAVLGFCINKHTRTQSLLYNYSKVTTAARAVVEKFKPQDALWQCCLYPHLKRLS